MPCTLLDALHLPIEAEIPPLTLARERGHLALSKLTKPTLTRSPTTDSTNKKGAPWRALILTSANYQAE
jgi:hypothetical protein